MGGKPGQENSVYTDSFYNSFELAFSLLDQRTFCTGTVRESIKKLTTEVINLKLKLGQRIAKYKRGDMIRKIKGKF